ncbi:PTHB1-like protein [Mya arenaria]|uniref:PTHB1-like protein n=1 Tax=Mya arenaria TaxID=6604 RepID=A0ABY7ENB5_MYAAR|nr:PTHB1-like protein [Mya arenaria]
MPDFMDKIQMKSRLRLENIKLTVHVQWPLASNLTNFTIPSVDDETESAVRIASAHIKLPLKLIVKPVLPVKNALFKITLDTNKQPTNLNDIFPDLLGENAGGQGAALGFQYFGGPVVTVLASKTSKTIQENDLQLEVAANALSCATNLFNFILKLWTNMSEEEFAVLQSSVTGLVVDTLEAGWEETVDASVTHLLRTVLAKSAKDQTLNPAPLKLPEDTSKVKKHLALLCDKLSKGARLVDGLPMNTGVSQADKPEKKNKVSSTRQTVIENGDMDHHDNDDNTETLIGSQFSRAKNRDRDDMNSNGLPSLKPLASKIHEPDGKKHRILYANTLLCCNCDNKNAVTMTTRNPPTDTAVMIR